MGIFDEVLSLLRDGVKSGEFCIMVMPPFEISFEPMDANAVVGATKKLGTTERDFNKELRSIESMLLALLEEELEDHIESVIKHAVENSRIEAGRAAERKHELEQQGKKIEEAFIGERLRQRYQLKAMSKGASFSGIDWDITIKNADSSGAAVRFPYATCRIRYQREFQWEPHLLMGGRSFDSVRFSLSKDEALHLRRELDRVLANLETAEKADNVPQG